MGKGGASLHRPDFQRPVAAELLYITSTVIRHTHFFGSLFHHGFSIIGRRLNGFGRFINSPLFRHGFAIYRGFFGIFCNFFDVLIYLIIVRS